MSGVLGVLLAVGGASSIVHVATSAVATEAGSSLTINKPTGTVAGNLMLAIMGDITGRTYTGDTGWTEAADHGADPGLRAAYKLAGGSEGSNYSFTASDNAEKAGVIVSYNNAAFDVAGSFDTSSAGSAIDAPSISLSGDGLLIAVFFIDQDNRTFTTPSGMTALVSNSGGNEPSFAIFYQEVSAGATGIKSSTPSGAGNSAGILIGLRSS